MKELMTIGEKYRPAMEITTQEEADTYFEECVRHTMKFGGHSRKVAEEMERQNLGYYAGYGSPELQERVNRLFKTKNPVLMMGRKL